MPSFENHRQINKAIKAIFKAREIRFKEDLFYIDIYRCCSIYVEDNLCLDLKNSLDDSTDKASKCSKILFDYISEKYGIDWSKEKNPYKTVIQAFLHQEYYGIPTMSLSSQLGEKQINARGYPYKVNLTLRKNKIYLTTDYFAILDSSNDSDSPEILDILNALKALHALKLPGVSDFSDILNALKDLNPLKASEVSELSYISYVLKVLNVSDILDVLDFPDFSHVLGDYVIKGKSTFKITTEEIKTKSNTGKNGK